MRAAASVVNSKERLGRISTRGDSYLRKLLIHGTRNAMRWRRRQVGLTGPPWLASLLERRPVNVQGRRMRSTGDQGGHEIVVPGG